ncbi:diphosphomevalonate decarboxylase [Woeseia oceani]|uniref:diphosphomevalonate decarboxylase n=1 Tax=Woeseia oceani TaxID=1548547 RepID=A0A193LCN8_9GAMM|nr:diphosphomevalonate decarboxylase [Woeseia oceani]ANO50201.1 diphosphomevalonate decarboxylase [Woeseia oceani]
MRAISQAQPNIALVKYWGKRDVENNLPATGSLSVTLDALWTRMSVEFDDQPGPDTLLVNGAEQPTMLPRVRRCLDDIAGAERPAARIESECNFPIAAGLASSASAFAALATAASKANGRRSDRLSLARAAGRASGSAARSLYPGFVELEVGPDNINLSTLATPEQWPLTVTVAVTEAGSKPVSSSAAMIISRQTSPFYEAWVERQPEDLSAAREAVAARDFAALAAVAEHNCLKMHSVMWSSRPSVVYWNSATLAALESVRRMQDRGDAVFFTIDAGPQVKVVSLPEMATEVADQLRKTAGVIDVLQSGLGDGARIL